LLAKPNFEGKKKKEEKKKNQLILVVSIGDGFVVVVLAS
jgi:hypothetical protein